MLFHFVKKELVDSLLNRRFLALAVFSIIMLPLSGLINYEYYQARQTSFENQKAQFEEDASQTTLRGYRAPEVLSVLARGNEAYMPFYYEFSARFGRFGEVIPGNTEAEDFRILATFGSFDFLFIVQIVFSLLAILLAFDMVAGEKERGTLRAVLANPVPRDKILLGKFIGGFVVLWVVFFIGFLLLIMVLSFTDSRFLQPETFGRIGLIFGTSSLYIAGFYSLGLLVSALCYTTRTAIVALLILWVVLELVVPKAGEMIAKVVVEVRTEESVRFEKAGVIEETLEKQRLDGGQIYRRLFGTDRLNSNLVREDTEEARTFLTQYRDMMEITTQDQIARIRAVDQAYHREIEGQRQMAHNIALLSPASAVSFLVSDLAGTGDVAYGQYRQDVEDHYNVLIETVYLPMQSVQVRVGFERSTFSTSIPGSGPDWDEVPAFITEKPPAGAILGADLWALIVLGLYVLIPFFGAYVAFLRYDVR